MHKRSRQTGTARLSGQWFQFPSTSTQSQSLPILSHGSVACFFPSPVDEALHRKFEVNTQAVKGAASQNMAMTPAAQTTQTRRQHRSQVEQSLVQATKQLKSQVGESKGAFKNFHEEFVSEIGNISYASDKAKQQLWEEKVKHNAKQEGSERTLSDHGAFLRLRLVDFKTAADKCKAQQKQSFQKQSIHDSRQTQISRVISVGQRIAHLTKLAPKSEDACRDLEIDLERLWDLINPSAETGNAKVLYGRSGKEGDEEYTDHIDSGFELGGEVDYARRGDGQHDGEDKPAAVRDAFNGPIQW